MLIQITWTLSHSHDCGCSRFLVHVRVCLVSRSHFADPKMADPANVWDLPIKFFLALEV